MFTFSRGFEAATLKIPNKEYTAYGGLVGTAPGSALASGLRGPSFPGYNAQNDPYNLNVDGAREGAVWPGSDDLVSNPQHFIAAGGLGGINAPAASSVPPRKQIIGFAKFRSREEALMARDVLQGKRVDIEKGAVLKAEMAKKNLHTKRGVGPVPGVNLSVTINPSVTPAGVPMSQNPGSVQLQQQPGQLTHLNGFDSYAEFKARDPMGLARLGTWRESLALQSAPQQQSLDHSNSSSTMSAVASRAEEEDRKRESIATALSSLSLGNSATASTPTLRGPRERVEEERKKDKGREKELNLMRLRASNSAAFDAFHSVGVNANTCSSGSISGVATPPNVFAGIGSLSMSRQNSTATSQGTTSGTNSGLLTPSSCTTPISISDSSPMIPGAEAQQKQEEIVGPWDNVNLVIPLSARVSSRPRSETQGSNSPMPSSQASDSGVTSAPNGLNALGHMGSVLNDLGRAERESQLLQHQSLVTHMVNGGMVDSMSMSSGASNASTGTTSPTLPSPASGGSNGSGSSAGGSVSTTGATSLRGSVDQNPPVSEEKPSCYSPFYISPFPISVLLMTFEFAFPILGHVVADGVFSLLSFICLSGIVY